MADLTPAEFFGAIQRTPELVGPPAPEPIGPTAPINGGENLAPFTTNALAALGAQRNAPPQSISLSADLSFQQRHGRKDEAGNIVPIDDTEGMPTSNYWRIAVQRGPEAQVELLQKLYPGSKSRILDSGDVTMEVMDSTTGKPKEVVLNPSGLNAHDLIDLTMQAPEIAASVATAIVTRGRGAIKTLAQMIASSVSGGVTGAGKDVIARKLEGISVRPDEIAQARGAETALDFLLQGGMTGLSKVFRAFSPFAKDIKPGSLEFDAQEGRAFLKRQFGETYEALPGEITGSPALKAVEALSASQPGSRTILGKQKESGNEVIRRVQKRALGQVLPEEQIGEEAIGALRRDVVEPLEGALSNIRQQALDKGHKRVVSMIDDAIGQSSAGRVTHTQAGGVMSRAFDEKMAAANAKVDEAYEAVRQLPGGTGDVLSGTPAANAAAEIRKELPTVQTTKKVVKYDQYGSPMEAAVPASEILSSGVPDGLLKALSDLESLKGGKVSLQTLTNMKKAAYDAIAQFKTAHGDVKDRWFSKIAGAYEKGIDEGIESAGTPELKTALTTAKETYKKELVPFEQQGIRELAKDTFDPGNLSPEQIVDRLFSGGKAIQNFQMLKDVLGENNPAFRSVKRAWMDTQIASVTDPITGTIHPGKLLDTMQKLGVEKPELAQELFGTNHKSLMQHLAGLDAIKRLPGALDENEVRALISLKNPTTRDLEAVIVMQRNRDTAYVNSILRDIADGLPVQSKLKPAEFVKRLRSANTPTAEVEQILGQIPTDVRESIATAEMYRLLDAASVNSAGTAAKAMRGEALDLSPSALAAEIGRKGTDQRARVELLLKQDKPPVIGPSADTNPTRLEVLEALVKTMAPREVKDATFKGAGGIGGPMIVQKIFVEPLQYATTYTKKAMLAVFYTSKPMINLLSNRSFDPETTAVIANTLIASEPVIRRLAETFGNENAQAIISDAKQSIDRMIFGIKADTPENRDKEELRKFFQGQPAKVKVTNP